MAQALDEDLVPRRYSGRTDLCDSAAARFFASPLVLCRRASRSERVSASELLPASRILQEGLAGEVPAWTLCFGPCERASVGWGVRGTRLKVRTGPD